MTSENSDRGKKENCDEKSISPSRQVPEEVLRMFPKLY
jgi:hypothetical protein